MYCTTLFGSITRVHMIYHNFFWQYFSKSGIHISSVCHSWCFRIETFKELQQLYQMTMVALMCLRWIYFSLFYFARLFGCLWFDSVNINQVNTHSHSTQHTHTHHINRTNRQMEKMSGCHVKRSKMEICRRKVANLQKKQKNVFRACVVVNMCVFVGRRLYWEKKKDERNIINFYTVNCSCLHWAKWKKRISNRESVERQNSEETNEWIQT